MNPNILTTMASILAIVGLVAGLLGYLAEDKGMTSFAGKCLLGMMLVLIVLAFI
jgi:hypothetical protein